MGRLECLSTNKEKVSHHTEFILKPLSDFEKSIHTDTIRKDRIGPKLALWILYALLFPMHYPNKLLE